jgi:hypothetical protein
MTIIASYNNVIVAEIVVAPNVALVAGRIFRYEPGIEDGSVFTARNGDKIRVRREDGRVLVTGWESEAADDTVTLITGTEGGSLYRSNGKTISFHKLAERIVASGADR